MLSQPNPPRGSKYSRMDLVNFFRGYLPQFLLGQFLDTLSQVSVNNKTAASHFCFLMHNNYNTN